MVRVLNHMQLDGASWGSMPLAFGLFVSISALIALCAKSARRKHGEKRTRQEHKADVVPKSPMASPRRIIETISNKAADMNSFMKRSKGENEEEHAKERFGEGGLWQNKILMGEKCQPLEFSGAIFYDNYGNRVPEMPKSPRASPMSTFSFPVMRESMA